MELCTIAQASSSTCERARLAKQQMRNMLSHEPRPMLPWPRKLHRMLSTESPWTVYLIPPLCSSNGAAIVPAAAAAAASARTEPSTLASSRGNLPQNCSTADVSAADLSGTPSHDQWNKSSGGRVARPTQTTALPRQSPSGMVTRKNGTEAPQQVFPKISRLMSPASLPHVSACANLRTALLRNPPRAAAAISSCKCGPLKIPRRNPDQNEVCKLGRTRGRHRVIIMIIFHVMCRNKQLGRESRCRPQGESSRTCHMVRRHHSHPPFDMWIDTQTHKRMHACAETLFPFVKFMQSRKLISHKNRAAAATKNFSFPGCKRMSSRITAADVCEAIATRAALHSMTSFFPKPSHFPKCGFASCISAHIVSPCFAASSQAWRICPTSQPVLRLLASLGFAMLHTCSSNKTRRPSTMH